MEVSTSLINHFRPLYVREEQGAYLSHGSATLLRGDKHHFVVTCAHCVLESKRKPLIMPCGSFRWDIKKFQEIFNSGGRDDDKVDIAAFKIPAESLQQFSPSCKFVHLRDIYAASNTHAYDVVACGFPLTWNKTHLGTGVITGNLIPQSQAFSSKAFTTRHRAFTKDGYDSFVHVGFQYPKRFPRIEGGTATSPLPRGMSGGPVFIVRSGEVAEFLLTGLVFERNPQEGYLVATLLKQVIEALYLADLQ
jgi:hypothetical protein